GHLAEYNVSKVANKQRLIFTRPTLSTVCIYRLQDVGEELSLLIQVSQSRRKMLVVGKWMPQSLVPGLPIHQLRLLEEQIRHAFQAWACGLKFIISEKAQSFTNMQMIASTVSSHDPTQPLPKGT